jgi:hypothetical protein
MDIFKKKEFVIKQPNQLEDEDNDNEKGQIVRKKPVEKIIPQTLPNKSAYDDALKRANMRIHELTQNEIVYKRGIHELQQELSIHLGHKMKVDEMTTQMTILKNEYDALVVELKKLCDQYDALELTHKNLMDKREDELSKIEEMNEKYAILTKERDDAISTSQKKCEDLIRQMAEFLVEKDLPDKLYKKYSKLITDDKEYLQEVERENFELKTKNRELEHQIEDFNSQSYSEKSTGKFKFLEKLKHHFTTSDIDKNKKQQETNEYKGKLSDLYVKKV